MAKRKTERKFSVKDSRDLGDMICQILDMVYVAKRDYFEEMAEMNDATLEQLAASAIASMVTERFLGGYPKREPGSKRPVPLILKVPE